MNRHSAILGLLAETPIHAGAGQSVGAIDLPIQREAHSDWPCVFGSAVKGALRARAEDGSADPSTISAIFGPDTSKASEHAGALMVSDARLLLLPVRSLTGHFKWVTCPALLRRLRRDIRRLGVGKADFEIPEVHLDQALLDASGNSDSTLFLEEFRLDVEKEDLSGTIGAISTLIPDPEDRELLTGQLTVVDDHLFGYLARYSIPVAAHIAIDNETKTVRKGALWYEETLPPETLLYLALSAWGSRKQDLPKSSEGVLQDTLRILFAEAPYLQLGGNETLGMGWCRVGLPGGKGRS